MEVLGPFPIHLLAENCGVNWSMKCFIISAVILALVLGVRCEKSVEEEVVGTYEAKDRGDTYGVVFLDNGVIETYTYNINLSISQDIYIKSNFETAHKWHGSPGIKGIAVIYVFSPF